MRPIGDLSRHLRNGILTSLRKRGGGLPLPRSARQGIMILLLGGLLATAEDAPKPIAATPPPAKAQPPVAAALPAKITPAPKPIAATPPPAKAQPPVAAALPAKITPAPKPAAATPLPAKAPPAVATVAVPAAKPTPPNKPTTQSKSPNPFVSILPLKTESRIDQLVMAKLRPLGIQPALCSDAVFVRRAYLDVLGIIPTAEEVRTFLKDPDVVNKRKILIDRLLTSDEFSVYWAMKWGDLLRIKAEFPINLWPNAAQLYHHWVAASLEENKPYDQFVREMLTASGSNFRVGPVNFYRAMPSRTPEGIASTVALTFMGARAEAWPQEKLTGMSVFFAQIGYKPTSEWKEEYVFWDPAGSHTLAGNSAPGRASVDEIGKPLVVEGTAAPDGVPTVFPKNAVFPDGSKAALRDDLDPREVFANWLISPKNPWFTRNIANRTWAWLMGRGIVQEPDDLRDDNPPSHPELLTFLEKELVDAKYDLKHLYRLILNSEAYQFASLPKSQKPGTEALFATYPTRRLEAEVLIDAINRITGTSELYTSPIPEPFTYIPQGQPAVSLSDGSITSPFLALFGRSARATGTEDERSNLILSEQWLHLLNSSHIQGKLETGPGLKALLAAKRPANETITELYLTILSRYPTREEVSTAKVYCGIEAEEKPDKPTRIEHWNDLAWALLNTHEFVFRH